MNTTTQYLEEIDREIAMRRQVYPGSVKAKKMTQATADKKTELMRSIREVLYTAMVLDIPLQDMRLPIYEVDGSPFPVTTLAPHIREVANEISWREHRLATKAMGTATKQAARRQLELMREVLQILQHIQTHADQAAGATGQAKLF